MLRVVAALALLVPLGATDVGVPDPAKFIQQHLKDAVLEVSVLEVGERGLFVYGRAVTDDTAELGTYCRSAREALAMILPGRSAHVLWHTPSGADHACPSPTTRRALPPRPGTEPAD